MDKDTALEVTSEMIAVGESVLEWCESDERREWPHSAFVRAMYIADGNKSPTSARSKKCNVAIKLIDALAQIQKLLRRESLPFCGPSSYIDLDKVYRIIKLTS